MTESTTHRPALHSGYFDGSLELLRELAVTVDLDAAWPRLSAIAGKMRPHDALRMACFDQGGHLVVNAPPGDVPEMTAPQRDELIIDDLRTGTPAVPVDAQAMDWLIDAGYRSFLGVSTHAPAPLAQVAFWSNRPLAFDRTQVPLARWIAYHLGLAVGRGTVGKVSHHVESDRP